VREARAYFGGTGGLCPQWALPLVRGALPPEADNISAT